ncbi:Thaumatin-like protein 1 [Apostasia shenzhenica]|uniref:Thaumatin-like protein 1 n=1 Tax=Apostasia shenzhenica TaxID=1088818 RepID=A0A2I0AM15_9ASPA|nr:Thaumatin-like protein 1 [Apostasia shenzhenica]
MDPSKSRRLLPHTIFLSVVVPGEDLKSSSVFLCFALISDKFCHFSSLGAICARFTITNNCGYTVWPGVLSGAGTAAPASTGFSLSHGESRTLDVLPSWSGRLWGRTLCSTDPSSGKFSCATGDCGSGRPECSGRGASPPATLAEFTLNGGGGLDYFDVSLVDGYNLPLLIVPKAAASAAAAAATGVGNCTSTGCAVDLNGRCPSDLRVILSDSGGDGGQSVACRSACEAFGRPEFCCSGAFGSPDTCKPSSYSQFFKNACPRSYSYAYDDASSTFTCAAGGDYVITFCPSTTSQKAGENAPANPSGAAVPLINDTMVFMGMDYSGAAAREPPLATTAAAVAVGLAVAHWLFL